jgi:hypothetical protein
MEFLLGAVALFQVIQFVVLLGVLANHNKLQERMTEIEKGNIAETARKYFKHLSTN